MKTLLSLLGLCALLPAAAQANDYPTQARVEYVLRCMEANGGESYDTLYPCICSIDKIAARLSYEEYVEGEAFALLRSTPGERGAIFRDPERARELSKKYTDAIEAAESSCFVKPRPKA